MQRQRSFWPSFLIVIALCILILIFSIFGKLKFISSFFERQVVAIQSVSIGIFRKMPFVSESKEIKELKQQNLELLAKSAELERVKKENQALSDQFQTTYPTSYTLQKAKVIGAPSFFPGASVPNNLIIDKGFKNGLKEGLAVVIKNNLVGIIGKISENISEIILVNNPAFSLTAKTQEGTVGIVKGGEDIVLGNVLLSENLKTKELVLTKGNIGNSGIGVIPDLIIGKVISIDKNPSELFQKAKIESFVNFADLDTVFVQMPVK